MLGNDHFYYKSIRNTVVTFGSLFNDIEIIRFTSDGTPKERYKVPLVYGPKEKYITRITSDPNLTKSVLTTVPRMAFNLTDISYDTSRKQLSTLRKISSTDSIVNSQYVPVPYEFNFQLSIFVRNIEDGNQILEQILPFFTPDFTVTVDFINSIEHKYDVPVILKSITSNIDYEGDFLETRLVTWDLIFNVKSYIFPPVKPSSIIRSANTNIFTSVVDPNTLPLVNVYTLPDPPDANPGDDYGFTEIITYPNIE